MRIRDFQQVMQKKSIDACFFYNINSLGYDPNLFYFSKYRGVGGLLILKTGKPVLIVPKMEIERAREHSSCSVVSWNKGDMLFGVVDSIIKRKKIKVKKIGIDKSVFALNVYKSLKKFFSKKKFVDIAKDCLKIREIKTEKEIAIIRKGCSITDKIMQKCFKSFSKFKTESDVSAFLQFE